MKPVDSEILRMMTQQGCIDLFWEKLAEARKSDSAVTRQQVFDCMNDHFFEVMGIRRYIDYECFRQLLKKNI